MKKYYTYIVDACKKIETEKASELTETIHPIGTFKGTVTNKKDALKFAFRQNPELLDATIIKIEVY